MSNPVDFRLAFLFPGQGSQSVGMLSALAEVRPEVRETYGTASAVLGYGLWDLVCNGPENRLNDTRITQPAILAAGVAVWRIWCAVTAVRPAWMAGHSLGEYTALVCSGALGFEDGLRLVSERARLMQEAVPVGRGAMAAVLGLGDEEAAAVCREASSAMEIVAAANFNAPGQVVIAGDKPAVDRAIVLAKDAGAKRAVPLPVSVPSHCPLMRPAAANFEPVLAGVAMSAPSMTVVHNVNAAPHGSPDAIRAALRDQLFGAVRWTESVGFMADQGVTRFVECGPGRVLAGLNKRIAPAARTEAIFDADSLAKALELAV